jgi:hypothetical protein
MLNSQAILAALQSRYGTQDLARYNVRRQPYYDFIRYPVAGTTELSFMVNPLGSVDPVSGLQKTIEETNVTRTAELPQNFILTQIRMDAYILPKNRQASAIQAVGDLYNSNKLVAVQAALLNLAGQGVLRIGFGDKEYFTIEKPIRKCPPGYGVEIWQLPGSNPGQTSLLQNLAVRPSSNPLDVWNVTPIVFIEKSQTIAARLVFPDGVSPTIPQVASADVAVNIGLTFDGVVIEPNQ